MKEKIFLGISLAIIAIGIIFNFIFGTSLDIQFTLAAQSSVIPILVVSSREKRKTL